MPEKQSSYRQIMKATSIFGGVQVFQIIIQVIKSKVVAVLLGTTGMGISGLLTTTTGFIAAITNFGLGTTGVKSIAEAAGTENRNRIEVIYAVLSKCIWITGILGSVITLVFSPLLSQLTFGNKNYTFAFIWLSITLILNQLSTGQLALLQGLRKYKYLANANITGAIIGLLMALPLYYFYGINGIVPAIIGTSVLNLIRSWYFVRKVGIRKVIVPKEITLSESKFLLKMGFTISLSGIVTIGTSYIIRIFISNTGGIEQVGLYTAGFTLLNSYVGLIFSAMATDYFPRLSARPNDDVYCATTINEQATISFLLLTPIITIFMIFCPLILNILYTKDFISIDRMLYWAIMGMLFRAASWTLSYIFIAKNNARLFFINEIISNINIIILNFGGYYFWGLEGIGIAFLATYILYLIQMSLLAYAKYKVKLSKETVKLFAIQVLFTIAAFIIVFFTENYYRFLLGIPLIAGSAVYSYINLDNRIGISTYFAKYWRNKTRN